MSRGADAIVVAPASADFLAKLAHGIADDLLSTLCLARECPLLVAPAMNRQMWANAATQRNVAQLAADGVAILGPDTGELACNENGEGRMLEPEELFAALVASRQPKVLAGKRVLLTAGPTFEAIDPGARHHQLELRQDGLRARAGGRRGRRGGDGRRGPVGAGDAAGRHAHRYDAARRRWPTPCSRASTAADVFIGVAAVADYTPATSHDAEAQEVRAMR